MKKTCFSFLILFLLLGGALFGFQKPNKNQPPDQKYEVTVRLVLVDVIATDKEGKVISDLTMDDFEIFEEGKKVSINSLDFVSFQGPEKTDIAQRNALLRKKRFFVIFDAINTIKRMLDRNKPQILERLIDLVKSGGEIMVLEMNEKTGIQVLQPLTSDEILIDQAIDKASGSIWVERATDSLATPGILGRNEVSRVSTGTDLSAAKKNIEQSAREVYEFNSRIRFEKSIINLLSIMNMIKDYPDRKSVLLVSGGFPAISFEKIYKDQGIEGTNVARAQVSAAKIMDPFRVLQKGKRRQGEDIIEDLIQFANSFNISFYTMDPDDYLRYVIPDIAFDNFPRTVEISTIKRNELENLKYLALDTDGEALQGAKKFDHFQKYVNRDMTSYYELSYYPLRKKADGKYHKIEVRVKRPDVKIRFRKGYFDYDPKQRESLLFVSASVNPVLFKKIPFQARAVPFVKSPDKFLLWINMALPVQDLILAGDSANEFKLLKVNLWMDDLQNVKAFNAQLNIPIHLSHSFRHQIQKARFYGYNICSQEIELDKKQYRMIFALYDEETDEIGTVEQMLDIPDLKVDTGVKIVNSVFGRMIESKEQGRSFALSQKDGTLWVSGHKFHPMGSDQFRRNEDVSLFIQAYTPLKKVGFKPQLSLGQNGREWINIPVQVVAESVNKKTKILNGVYNLDFSRSQPGEYILKIKLIDSVDNTEVEKKIQIRIL